MRRLPAVGLLVLVAFISVVAGCLIRGVRDNKTNLGRRILYYVDPMHPAYRSNAPGIAPDCGMPLVPVYEGEYLANKLQLSPNTFFVDNTMQELTGVRVETVKKNSGPRLIRAPARVEVEANRLYRLTAATEGYVRFLGNNPSGTVVKKGEVLATFFSLELRGVEQGYIGALQVHPQGAISQANLRISEDQLRGLGMSEEQIMELAKTHEYVSDIKIVAPVDGVISYRGINPKQRFQAQTELYRVADLSKVWVIADVYSDQLPALLPGARATVKIPQLSKTLSATVDKSLPLFDPGTRTLKLRLEADNPDLLLRPDMFVDVDFNVATPGEVLVPAEAVIDSGQQKVVYVETGTDLFEPRPVEVGTAYDDRVVIDRGLKVGDRIVTSGTFLIDSESRLRTMTSHPGQEGPSTVVGPTP